jgi:competence ComEA-like helix-hairpin-helix protein
MAKISLRVYNREIEKLIETGQTEEAIAHCRYILQIYPKHIYTYRLLGKAYLESQRYGDASDILQRVLSAIPDDFVSHVGMSIIREDEGNLDAAIWHMERSFEIQPSNAAIQEELRRLYGKRDGLEPPKIHLTRGALARMYAKGNLFPQAIAELRTILAEDPQRPEIQVLLARMYANSGQRVEAVETCNAILSKLPFCLEANLILADILANSERAAEAASYRQRVQAIDPYMTFVTTLTFSSDQVPDNAVLVDRFEWLPGQIQGKQAGQPDWVASLGIDVQEMAAPEEILPDWLADTPQKAAGVFSSNSQEEQTAVEKTTKPAIPGKQMGPAVLGETPDWLHEGEEPVQPSDQIPDWMKSVGWTSGSGESKEVSKAIEFEEDDEGISENDLARAEIPDWLRSIAPSTVLEQRPATTSQDEMGETPPWMMDEIQHPADTAILGEPAQEKTEEPQGEPAVTPVEQAGPIESFETPIESDEEQLPGWLESAASSQAVEIPEWLKDLPQEPASQATGLGEEIIGETSEVAPLGAGWSNGSTYDETQPLEDAGMEETAPEELPEVPTEGLEAETAGLIGVVSIEEAVEPPTTEEEKAQPVELPASLEMEAVIKEVERPGMPPVTEEATPPQPETPVPSLDDEAAALAWLESLAVRQGAQEEELLTSPEDRTEKPPEWVQKMAAEDTGEVTVEGIPEMVEAIPAAEKSEIPEWLQEFAEEIPFEEPEETQVLPPSEEGATELAEAEIPEWLRGIAEESQVEETAPEPEPVSGISTAPLSDENIPAWLSVVLEENVEEAEQLSPEPAEVDIIAPLTEADIPEWLRGMTDMTPSDESEAAVEADQTPSLTAETELSEWMVELGEEAAVEPVKPVEPEVESDTLVSPPMSAETESVEPEMILGDTRPTRVRPPQEEPETKGPEEVGLAESIAEEPEEAQPAPFEAQPAPGLEDEEAAIAWLESLALRQGASEEEMVTSPEERAGTPPEWIQKISTSEEALAVETEPEEPVEIILPESVEMEGMELESEELAEAVEAPYEPEISQVEPIENLVEEVTLAEPEETPFPFEPEVLEEAVEEQAIAEQPPAEEMPELPDWLSEYAAAEPQEAEEEYTWTPPAEAVPLVERPITPIDINTASLRQLENLPGIGFIRAQGIIEYRETFGPFATLDELRNISGIDPDTLNELSKWITLEVSQVPQPEEVLPTPSILNEARNRLAAGDITASLDRYLDLIHEERNLPEIIHDIQQALTRFPQDIMLYQTLGDALVRNNQLQEALDAYTTAEELLR